MVSYALVSIAVRCGDSRPAQPCMFCFTVLVACLHKLVIFGVLSTVVRKCVVILIIITVIMYIIILNSYSGLAM